MSMERRSFLQRMAVAGLGLAFGQAGIKTFNNNSAYEQVEKIMKATGQLYARGGNPNMLIWQTDFGPLAVVDSRLAIAEWMTK